MKPVYAALLLLALVPCAQGADTYSVLDYTNLKKLPDTCHRAGDVDAFQHVSKKSEDWKLPVESVYAKVFSKLRYKVVRLGGNAVVITNRQMQYEGDGYSVSYTGVGYACDLYLQPE